MQFVSWLNEIIWAPLVYFTLGVGLFFSIATRFLQARHIKSMVKLMFEGKTSDDKDSKAGITPFQALSLSLSSRIGVGNIAGVATAIAYGGPGSLFWMWMMAFLGGATAFIESTLAQIYKTKENGQLRGGIPYYIEKGLSIKWLSVLVAIVALICYAILFPGIQSNSISSGLHSALGINTSVTGIILVALLGFIIFGGVQRISNFAQAIVPFMALGYILVAVYILIINITEVPNMLALVFSSAFGTNSIFGGIIGSAIAWGVRRALFSNVAGVGEGTYSSAAADVSHPAKQGLVQAFSIYIDTLFICTATGFMILLTGMYNVTPVNKEPIVHNIGNVEPGPIYTQSAVDTVLPGFGSIFVAIAIFFFAFTTLMAFYYIAETNLSYITRSIRNVWLEYILKFILLTVTYYGSVQTAEFVWVIGDIGYGSLAWLNIITLLILAKTALKTLKDYEIQKKNGINPIFDPIKLGIKGATYWEKEFDSKRFIYKETYEKKVKTKDLQQ